MKSLTIDQQQKLISMVTDLTLWLWNMNDYDSREVEKLRLKVEDYIDKVTGEEI